MSRSWVGRTGVGLVAVTLAGSALLAEKGASQDWPQFRGVNRDGVSAETGLLKQWPEKGPKEVWRKPLGAGYSSISVVV